MQRCPCTVPLILFHSIPDGMYGGRMPNYSKSQCSKEANLMPVPSPQQIQFPLLGRPHKNRRLSEFLVHPVLGFLFCT